MRETSKNITDEKLLEEAKEAKVAIGKGFITAPGASFPLIYHNHGWAGVRLFLRDVLLELEKQGISATTEIPKPKVK